MREKKTKYLIREGIWLLIEEAYYTESGRWIYKVPGNKVWQCDNHNYLYHTIKE